MALKRNKRGRFLSKKEKAALADPAKETNGEDSNRPEWEILPWNEILIKQWSSDPEFKVYCEAQGLELASGVSDLKTTRITSENLDISDIAKVVAETTARVMSQQALPTVSPGPAVKGSDLVKFPDPLIKEVSMKDGQTLELEQPLYPVNIAGEDYSGSGYYTPEVTELLKTEIEDARWVKIPYNAAFVEYTFHRTNEKGKIEKIKEMFTGPGIFAGKSLAASIEAQLGKLVEHTLPGGPDDPLIPGTKTQHNDLVTNGVLFVPGYTYLVPKHVADDLTRRMREHIVSFQRVHQERVSLGKHGLSMYSGVQLGAQEAISRQQAGMEPSQIDKVVREGRI